MAVGNAEIEERLTRKQRQILRMILAKSSPETTYILDQKQNELAKQLKITRQGLSLHLHKLREDEYIRTGMGFILVTEKGLRSLGVDPNPSYIFIKISPLKREASYREISKLSIHHILRVAGDMDAILIVDRKKLDEVLLKLTLIEGVQETKSFIVIKTIK